MTALRIRTRVIYGLTVLVVLAVAPRAGAAVTVTTEPTLYPAFDEAVTDYVTRCTAGMPVGVSVSAIDGTTLDVDGQGPRSGTYTTHVAIVPGQAFRMVATTGSAGQTYYVRCLPADFPAWTFQRSGRPQAQWYAIAPATRTDFSAFPPGVSPNYVALFDTNGVPVWWMKASPGPIDFSVLRNGNVAWSRNDATGDEEHLLDGSLVRVLAAVGAGIDIHEFMLLGDGNYLLTTQRTITGTVPCAQSEGPIADNGVQEIAPDGSLVWSWWASDHIPVSEVPSVWCDAYVGPASDAYHINSAEPAAGGFVLSFRHLDAVYGIEKASGNVLWKLGGVPRPESLTVVGDSFPATDLFRGQHDARVVSDGSVTVHDNGFHPGAPRPPRAVRYTIDASARTATLVEQKNDPGTVPTPSAAGAPGKLPGGDWVMSWGSSGVITELGPSGERVLSLTFDDHLFSYRARPVLAGRLSRAALRDAMDAQFPGVAVHPRGAPRCACRSSRRSSRACRPIGPTVRRSTFRPAARPPPHRAS